MGNSPFNPRVVVTGVQGVSKSTGGKMAICDVPVKYSMPCIAILVHGVNDVDEAYQNQEQGIIAGLNERMGRTDIHPYEWQQYKMDTGDGEQQNVKMLRRSPVIPFYWGYKPVDHVTYIGDQRRYHEERAKSGDAAKSSYNAYQEDGHAELEKLRHISQTTLKYQNDNFGNVLDDVYIRGGGTFANAMTTTPDMLGPGSGSLTNGVAGFASLYMNAGDFTHPIYGNPYRIYQFFAAQRLADLILVIRREPAIKSDPINIIAYSQGMITIMPANMLVKTIGADPADCVILSHSPYAPEKAAAESMMPGHHQTDRARQQTFKNFYQLMATNARYGKGQYHTQTKIDELEGALCLSKTNSQWRKNKLYTRNNFGKVYNYFCFNDSVVSLLNIQGLGWRGVPHNIASGIDNLHQRVFCENGPEIGGSPLSVPSEMSALEKNSFNQDTGATRQYTFVDAVANGEQLLVTFRHQLQGVGSQYKYSTALGSLDQGISFSAKVTVIAYTETDFKNLSGVGFDSLQPGQELTPTELAIFAKKCSKPYTKGVVLGEGYNKTVQLTYERTPDELQKEWMQSEQVDYSQRSSTAMPKDALVKAMPFDLVVGVCRTFGHRCGEFWTELLLRRGWRMERNGLSITVDYYNTGKLSKYRTKDFMSRPDDILPKGKLGAVNEYCHSITV